MQMPGGRMKRSASMNIYTALLFFAVVGLGVACGVMYVAAKKVGANGDPFALQDGRNIKIATKPAR
jgi:hypothetical protein